MTQLLNRLPKPEVIAGKALKILSNFIQPEEVEALNNLSLFLPLNINTSQLIPAEERQRLINSVVNYQSLTVRQGGVVEMQFTVGDAETSLFKIQQITRKKLKETYFIQVFLGP